MLAVAEHAGDVAEGAAGGDLDPVTSFFHGTGLSGEGLVAVGGMTPAGGWDISKPEPKSGGCVQLATRLKSTVPPENSAPAKSTVSPENSAREKLTVPPENSAAWKKTIPPEVSAPVNVGLSPVNLEWEKWTSAPENLALVKLTVSLENSA